MAFFLLVQDRIIGWQIKTICIAMLKKMKIGLDGDNAGLEDEKGAKLEDFTNPNGTRET